MAIKATYQMAMAAARDAGNRSMNKDGRTQWNETDWNIAVDTFNSIFGWVR